MNVSFFPCRAAPRQAARRSLAQCPIAARTEEPARPHRPRHAGLRLPAQAFAEGQTTGDRPPAVVKTGLRGSRNNPRQPHAGRHRGTRARARAAGWRS